VERGHRRRLVGQGGPARLKSGEAGLVRALGVSLHDDGGLVSRSPTEQVAVVEILGQLRAVYIAGRRDVPEWLADHAGRSGRRPPRRDPGRRQPVELAGRQHGQPAPGSPPPPRVPASWSGRSARRAAGGYQRLQARASVVGVRRRSPAPAARA
jgi:hypothetical protein